MAVRDIKGIKDWRLDCDCTPPYYRIINKFEGIEIWFEAQHKNGCYFHIKSVSYNGRIYSAQKYHYKFISLVREVAFEIYKEDGLWDYTDNKRHFSINGSDETVGSFLGKKLNMRVE